MLLTIKKIIKYCIYRWKFREKHVEFDMSCNLSFDECICEGSNVFHSSVCFRGRIGYASYIGTNSALNAVIGRYCSIASNVKCVAGKHPTKYFVSTHPSFFSMKKQSGFTYVESSLYDENPVIDDQGHLIEIGNDVWIGANVLLLPKIRIGDGAIVAAGSVVTNNVAPYTIVAGVPAKMIKKRFEEDEIEFLLGLKWWNQSEEWIVSHSKYFSDIKQFIIKCKLEGLK